MRKLLALILLSAMTLISSAQQKTPLWKGVAPLSSRHAYMLNYPAPDSNNCGAAVIICPGGSYHHLGMRHEGRLVAEWFNRQGVSAFVLRYRTSGWGYHAPAMFEDFQRAMQIIHQNAQRYGIDTARVGAIGFSAGGHLVATMGATPDNRYLTALGLPTDENLRPRWVAPIYPVVSMQDSIAHARSRRNLLTRRYTPRVQNLYSLELCVPKDMPPVFLQASVDDPVVDYRNSVCYARALKEAGIDHTFTLLELGGHGYGMKAEGYAYEHHWQEHLLEWLKTHKFVK